MFQELKDYLTKPTLYAPSTGKFWDDEHISKGMLQAHLDQNWDASTRNYKFVDKSVEWIVSIAPPECFPKLLDLGCGPGIYAERFNNFGYTVTGIDFSKRSINYAKEQSLLNQNSIEYFYENYLEIDYDNCFDVVTLIYCDYGALSTDDRKTLLTRAYKALKVGGKLIFDVFTPNQYTDKFESNSWEYCSNGGFWSNEPHVCLNSFYRYDMENTVVNQTVIIGENEIKCYNIWDHYFTKDSLISEVKAVGFQNYEIFNDVSGAPFTDDNNVLSTVLTK